MKISRIAIAAAAFFGANGSAMAACNVTGNIVTFTVTGNLTETDCASTATVATQGIAITTLQTDKADKSYVDSENDAQDDVTSGHGSAISALQTENAGQQDQLDDHEDRLGDVEAKNDEQDERLDKQKAAIKANYRWDAKQQKQINHLKQSDKAQWHKIKKLKQENEDQWDHIGSLETLTSEHEGRLNAHDAVLSQHSATLAHHGERLDSQAKGIAIATAMPDTWLQPHEKFAIAGGLGGFDSEAAVAFSAIGRIDGTWSLNAGLGSDVEFKEFGWKVGARAGW